MHCGWSLTKQDSQTLTWCLKQNNVDTLRWGHLQRPIATHNSRKRNVWRLIKHVVIHSLTTHDFSLGHFSTNRSNFQFFDENRFGISTRFSYQNSILMIRKIIVRRDLLPTTDLPCWLASSFSLLGYSIIDLCLRRPKTFSWLMLHRRWQLATSERRIRLSRSNIKFVHLIYPSLATHPYPDLLLIPIVHVPSGTSFGNPS